MRYSLDFETTMIKISQHSRWYIVIARRVLALNTLGTNAAHSGAPALQTGPSLVRAPARQWLYHEIYRPLPNRHTPC